MRKFFCISPNRGEGAGPLNIPVLVQTAILRSYRELVTRYNIPYGLVEVISVLPGGQRLRHVQRGPEEHAVVLTTRTYVPTA